MIDTNLALIREQEQARVNIFMSKNGNSEEMEHSVDMDNQLDAVDQVLLNILRVGKEDCEALSDYLITIYNDGGELVGEKVAPMEFHCKTPIKTKKVCRNGKKKKESE
jgi:hypothetical protein